jgi:glycosyltransferase involved in cell wall biosynthesis
MPTDISSNSIHSAENPTGLSMKITIIGTAFPLRGGIAHFNALLASHLGKRHSIQTITFSRQYPAFLFPGKSQEESGSASESMMVPPAPQRIDSINPFSWIRVGRELRRSAPDLIIMKYWLPFFGPCFGTIARIAKRNRKTRVLYICDNVIPHERRPGDIAFTRYAFRYADGFIVQSDAVEQDLLKLLPEAKYRKVPHPVYEIFGPSIGKEAARKKLGLTASNVILFFGYVRAYKGLMTLIDAMARLPGVLLLVVGEFYDSEEKYRRHVADTGVDSRVRFYSEYIPNDQVVDYFCASDVVVLPYLSATQSGITQIAYNFDKPVIATDVGGLAEVVIHEKTGLVVEPGNPASLADAIRRFYADNLESAFSANVREEKKKYSWDNLVANIEELGSAQ